MGILDLIQQQEDRCLLLSSIKEYEGCSDDLRRLHAALHFIKQDLHKVLEELDELEAHPNPKK